jgi:hypothetical protein
VIAPDDPRHGTTAGFHAGCPDDCCRLARNADAKRGRIERQLGYYRRVPAVGTQRRLRALARMGWSGRHVCRLAGYSARSFHPHLMRCTWLSRATAAKIAAIYDQLSMREGPSTFARRHAERNGWPPPLAWDDDEIDDPDAQPAGSSGTSQPGPRSPVDAGDVEHLLSFGEHTDAIAERFGVDRESLYRALHRRGRSDLVERLQGRVAA